MYITLILFWIGILGFLLHRKNIISQTSRFLSLESYPSVDLKGPTFKSINEGLLKLKVTFLFSRFMVPGFFGREVGFSGASCIISSHIVIKQSILSVGAFYVNIFVIRGIGVPNHRVPRWALNGLFKWITNRIYYYRSERQPNNFGKFCGVPTTRKW